MSQKMNLRPKKFYETGRRVPFLDREFLEYAMTLDPAVKMVGLKDGKRIEKFILRQAFDDPSDPFLPHEILWCRRH
jgi:asparagine synthase (glutamine-hydrolysing)